jgi:hypothetical protein
MKFLKNFLFFGSFFALLDPDPDSESDPDKDPLTWMNPDPVRIRKTLHVSLVFLPTQSSTKSYVLLRFSMDKYIIYNEAIMSFSTVCLVKKLSKRLLWWLFDDSFQIDRSQNHLWNPKASNHVKRAFKLLDQKMPNFTQDKCHVKRVIRIQLYIWKDYE